MTSMGRRKFLKSAGGAFVATAGFLYPGAAEAARRVPTAAARSGKTVLPDPGGPDPTYAGGVAAAKTADGVVLQSNGMTRAVRIPSGHEVWKEHILDIHAIQLGDWVDAKGEPQVDGSLLAISGMIFVNIARRDGIISANRATGLTLKNDNGTHDLDFSDILEVIDATTGNALAGGVAALPVGTAAGAVGLQLPDGRLRATRIWV